MGQVNAPEKIYLQQYDENTLICLNKWNVSGEWSNKLCNEKVATNIEYTRTDAFIEEACEWIREINNHHHIMRYSDSCEPPISELIEWFKTYMEEGGKDE